MGGLLEQLFCLSLTCPNLQNLWEGLFVAIGFGVQADLCGPSLGSVVRVGGDSRETGDSLILSARAVFDRFDVQVRHLGLDRSACEDQRHDRRPGSAQGKLRSTLVHMPD